MEFYDIEAASKKAIALRSIRSSLWETLDNFDLDLYSKDSYKEYKFISKKPKEDAMRLAKLLTSVSPYVTVHSFVFGNEQIISIDNDKVAHIYYCDKDIELIREFNKSRLLYSPEYFISMKEGAGKFHKKQKPKPKQNIYVKKNNNNTIDKYFENCKILFARHDEYITSVDIWTIAKELKKKYDKIKYGQVKYVINKTFLFEDFRFKCITLVDSDNKTFLWLFNNLEYEALPLTEGKLHPAVVYRYKLYANLIGKKIEMSQPDSDLPDEYIGQYVNEKSEKFKLGGFMVRMPLD